MAYQIAKMIGHGKSQIWDYYKDPKRKVVDFDNINKARKKLMSILIADPYSFNGEKHGVVVSGNKIMGYMHLKKGWDGGIFYEVYDSHINYVVMSDGSIKR